MRHEIAVLIAALALLDATAITAARAEEVTPEKAALVQEYLEVTRSKVPVAEMLDAFLGQMDPMYERIFDQFVSRSGADDARQEALRARYDESLARIRESFRALYTDRIDLEFVVERVYAPIYARYFTEQELRDLIAFYRSATGQKVLTTLPNVILEATAALSEELMPIITEMANQVFERELAVLAKRS